MNIGASVENKRRSIGTFRAFTDGSAAIVRAASEAELLSDMCRALVEKGGYPLACILRAENGTEQTLRPVASFGIGRSVVEALNFTWGVSEKTFGSCGIAVRTARPAVQNYSANPSGSPWRSAGLNQNLVSNAAIPVKVGATVFGALVVASAETGAFDTEEIEVLVEFADMLSSGMDMLRARTERETFCQVVEENLKNTVQALGTALEYRDPFTAGHQRNVAALSVAIGQEMNLSSHEIEGIRFGALLHDIGKIKIPLDICSKAGRLILPEIQLIQTHAEAGYAILKNIDFQWPVASMVLQHHERLDGSGYPQGLKGDAILLGSRIIAVADVVEAMMSHRPYRAALGQSAAIDEIQRGRGLHFDPSVVDACITISRRPGFARLVLESAAEPGSAFLDETDTQSDELRQGAEPSAHGTNPPRLTLQQSAVMQLVAEGKSVKEIARYMNISVSTVKAHLSITYKTLGA